jgi:predicted transposase YbfD/YdcC
VRISCISLPLFSPFRSRILKDPQSGKWEARQIAVDGKAVRGARNREGKALHLVAALAHGIGAVLGQVAVDAKSSEIPAVRELLKAFTDLAGAVITVGALHTQGGTAQAVTGRRAGCVMTVRASMPALCKRLEKLPWTAIPAASAVSTGLGGRARRTIRAMLVPAWTGFAGAAQVAQVRRTVTGKGKKTAGVGYRMTSVRGAGPAALTARGPRPPGDRKPASLGPRRDVSGG